MTHVMVQSLLCKPALKQFCNNIHFPSHLFIFSSCMLEFQCKQQVLRLNVPNFIGIFRVCSILVSGGHNLSLERPKSMSVNKK